MRVVAAEGENLAPTDDECHLGEQKLASVGKDAVLHVENGGTVKDPSRFVGGNRFGRAPGLAAVVGVGATEDAVSALQAHQHHQATVLQLDDHSETDFLFYSFSTVGG